MKAIMTMAPSSIEYNSDGSAIRIKKFSEQFRSYRQGLLKDWEQLVVSPLGVNYYTERAGDLPVFITQGMIRHIVAEHAIDIDNLMQLQKWIDRSVLTMDSTTRSNGIVVLTDTLANNQEPLIVAIHTNKRKHQFIVSDVRSAYGNAHLERTLNDVYEKGLQYYVNEKTATWLIEYVKQHKIQPVVINKLVHLCEEYELNNNKDEACMVPGNFVTSHDHNRPREENFSIKEPIMQLQIAPEKPQIGDSDYAKSSNRAYLNGKLVESIKDFASMNGCYWGGRTWQECSGAMLGGVEISRELYEELEEAENARVALAEKSAIIRSVAAEQERGVAEVGRIYEFDVLDETVEVVPQLDFYSQVADAFGEERINLAVRLDELAYYVGESKPRLEPYGTATVNLGEFIGIPNAAYIDINNNPGIDKWLGEQGLAEATAFSKHSGFVEYPLYVFKDDFIRELAGDNPLYQEYLKQFDFAYERRVPVVGELSRLADSQSVGQSAGAGAGRELGVLASVTERIASVTEEALATPVYAEPALARDGR
jgi:hypothetical protein